MAYRVAVVGATGAVGREEFNHATAQLTAAKSSADAARSALLAAREQADAQTKLFAGWRVDRKDTASKRWASRWANRIRQYLLRDDTPDTGCGIKLFERATFLELPYFDHMHRYLPALMQRAGWKTVSVPVSHRPRRSGQSKYTNLGRALVGVRDLMGVSWLIQRSHVTPISELNTGRTP